MAKRDIKIADDIILKWGTAAGGSWSVSSIIKELLRLIQFHGDDFSLQKACDTLQRLSDDALAIKKDLEEASSKK